MLVFISYPLIATLAGIPVRSGRASPTGNRRLTVSIGIACIEPLGGRSHYGFIQLADEALYAAKARGRNCIVIMDKEYGELSTGTFRKGSTVKARATP